MFLHVPHCTYNGNMRIFFHVAVNFLAEQINYSSTRNLNASINAMLMGVYKCDIARYNLCLFRVVVVQNKDLFIIKQLFYTAQNPRSNIAKNKMFIWFFCQAL